MIRLSIVVLTLLVLPLGSVVQAEPQRPNVVLIITDDQGHGDLGCHGNPIIKTPHLDRLAGQSVRLKQFYVSPVCAPTRASLLTGRYNYRTRVVDTYLGRALMDPEEKTLAELLGGSGYRTGIFGKWHLGDNFPLRPMDQGFQESLVLKGGGLGQPSDLPEGTSYFDPLLLHNGQPVRRKGYCSDVFTEAALVFIRQAGDRPFFTYLAFNAPHDPLEVPDSYVQPYWRLQMKPADFPQPGRSFSENFDPQATAKTYGMITNIDDNVGRLLDELDRLKIAERTLVIFLTDNGPQRPRYNSGMRGLKGSVYEGGIRVPCFVRCPWLGLNSRDVDLPTAHIDLVPTILSACSVPLPADITIDGQNLLPVLRGEQDALPDRTLFFQWHRGDAPEPLRACAARSGAWKLIQPLPPSPMPPRFELYNLDQDPFEQRNLADEKPELTTRLREELAGWFKDVSSTRGFDPPRIKVGTPAENPTLLTRQDWRGPRAGWTSKSLGYWELDLTEGSYEVVAHFDGPAPDRARLEILDKVVESQLPREARRIVLGPVKLSGGPARLTCALQRGQDWAGPKYVEVRRIP